LSTAPEPGIRPDDVFAGCTTACRSSGLKDGELALELCARADVVIENFRPGGAARLGLD
jgi:hypothetical protein